MADETGISVAKRPRARKRRFYRIGPDWNGRSSGLWVEDESILPPYEVDRLPASLERVPMVFDKSIGVLPRDLEPYYSWWLISDRTKVVFERLDPEAFRFVPCDLRAAPGIYNWSGYWLCDVVRVLDALDESQSRLKIGIRDDIRALDHGMKYYEFCLTSKLVFREAEIGKAHIFHMAYCGSTVICDQEFKDACKSAGLKRISFRDVLKL